MQLRCARRGGLPPPNPPAQAGFLTSVQIVLYISVLKFASIASGLDGICDGFCARIGMIEMESDIQPAGFDWKSVEVSTVPARLYDYDLELLMDKDHIIHIAEFDVRKPDSIIGAKTIYVIPELRIAMKAIQDTYKLNQRDTYATMIVYGLSSFEHTYNPDLKRVRANRNTDFFSGTKMGELVERFGYCEHFFKKTDSGKGNRKEVKLFGDSHRVLAAIGENAEFFNLSMSDISQVILSHAIVRWDKLPPDFKKFFEEINKQFETHAKGFYVVCEPEPKQITPA